ncbi:MAG: tetratricopeptide repeat protein [Bryobacterales bacterium]|nr:tetratricopeptide repeat protein [Bryobacterales bacterium]
MPILSISLISLLTAASWQDDHRDGLAALHQGHYQRAASLLETAFHTAGKENVSPLWMGRLRNNHASALYQSGAFAEAETGFQQALRFWRSAPDASPHELARTHNNLAVLYRQWWRLDDAALHAREALQLDKAALFWHTLGEILRFQGRFTESLQALDAAQQSAPDLVELGTILQARAGVAIDQGQPAQAEPLYRQAVHTLQSVYTPSHPAVLAAKGNLGVTLVALRKWDEAQPLLESVHLQARAALGDRHPRVAAAANNLAQLYRAQKRYSDADTLYREALSVWRRAFGPSHPEYAKGLHNLASLFVEQGKLQGAEKLYTEAIRIAESQLGRNHSQTRLHASGLEQIYKLQNRRTELDRLLRTFR